MIEEQDAVDMDDVVDEDDGEAGGFWGKRTRPTQEQVAEAVAGFIKLFGGTVHDLVALAARPVKTPAGHAYVMTAEGPPDSDVDFARIAELLEQLNLPRPELRGHETIRLEWLEMRPAGQELIRLLRHVVKPFVAAGYNVFDAFIKTRRNNEQPMHQDRKTGECVFQRISRVGTLYPDRSLCFGRLLVSLSNAPRRMVYSVGEAGDPVLVTTARYVFMDGPAAGSGLCSGFFHGRVGDGCTVSIDLAMPLPAQNSQQTSRRVKGVTDLRGTAVTRLLGRQVVLEAIDRRPRGEQADQRRMVDQARMDAACERAAAFDPSTVRGSPHCICCGDGDPAHLSSHRVRHGAQLAVFCQECLLRYYRHIGRGGLPSSIPAELLFIKCDCAGCHPDRISASAMTAQARESKPSADEEAERRYNSLPQHERDASREARHCHCCGVPTNGPVYGVVGGMSVRLCVPCYEQQRKRDLKRWAKCPADCPGCKRPAKMPSFEEGAQLRYEAISVDLRDRGSDLHHCYHCGTFDLSNPRANWHRVPANTNGGAETAVKRRKRGHLSHHKGPLLRLCNICGSRSYGKLLGDRLMQCPPDCRGCKF